MNFKILWAYCDLCECVTAICPTCKNNMCNGGNGGIIRGQAECLDCDKTHDEWDKAFKEDRVPLFTEAKNYIAGAQENPWSAQIRMICKKK